MEALFMIGKLNSIIGKKRWGWSKTKPTQTAYAKTVLSSPNPFMRLK
jgi:hypothetical protein